MLSFSNWLNQFLVQWFLVAFNIKNLLSAFDLSLFLSFFLSFFSLSLSSILSLPFIPSVLFIFLPLFLSLFFFSCELSSRQTLVHSFFLRSFWSIQFAESHVLIKIENFFQKTFIKFRIGKLNINHCFDHFVTFEAALRGSLISTIYR